MFTSINNQKGAAPLIFLVVVVGLIGFLAINFIAPSKNNLLSSFFPKDASKAAGGVVELSILPSQQAIPPAGSFKVDIAMDTKGLPVSASQIQLNFDSQYLQATQITAGGLLPQTLLPGTIGSDNVTITVGAPPTSPAIGTGTIASVTFNALPNKTGSTQLTLDSINTVVAAIGSTGNVIGALYPAVLSIGLDPSPIASSSPQPSPVVSPSLVPTPLPSIVVSPSPIPTPSSIPSLSPAAVSIEAETMSLIANSKALQIITDSQASAGKAMLFYSNAVSNGTFTTSSALTKLNVRAKGDQCKGAPQMVIKIDNVQLAKKETAVSSASWADYLFSKNIAPGTHTFSVAFTNDYIATKGSHCDRNLTVDKISFQ